MSLSITWGDAMEQPAPGEKSQETEPIFINRNLFSSYYMGTLLAREVRTRQGETGIRMPLAVRRRLTGIWERVTPTLGSSTLYGRTRQVWLEPLLLALGYEPLTEAHAAEFGEETLPPGYLLYRSPVDTAIREVQPPVFTDNDADDANDATLSSGGVLLSLLAWGDDFDRPFGIARRRSEAPHTLMERLLAAGPAQWGLLCNGRRLRLLKRTIVAGRQQYFEVDLEALFEHGTERDFDTFWSLFRVQSFHPGKDGRCLLDVVDEGSRKHATGVSKTLSSSVFRAIEVLMSALVGRAQQLAQQAVPPDDEQAVQQREMAAQALAQLPLLYQQSLVLLYRLLFVLYAESRLLLPLDNEVYRDSYSLEPLRDEITLPNRHYQPTDFRLWETVQALFRLIRAGCNTTRLVIPAYNGDLFHPQSTALLNALRVPDAAFAEVLQQLSVTPPTRERGRERIDYRDLGVEQLGSVYEGLLEYEPRIAREPMVEVIYKGERAIIPAREQGDYKPLRTFETGAFYLGHGAGRKTSGSYYTPQPLVDFLVRRTLGPLVQGKTAAQILALKVVDPAMGSGAFLVGACLFLAEAYARAIQLEATNAVGEPFASDLPISDALEHYTVNDALEDALSEEATRPYRRLIAERCLYGVDLNPMAVELAKVSLWLTTLAGDKPLTFLDANLRYGNSLIGAPRDVERLHPEANKRLLKLRGMRQGSRGKSNDDALQLGLFDEELLPRTVEPLVSRRRWIAETPSDTVAQVHEKANLFRFQIEGDRERTTEKTLRDLWVASWFWRQPPRDAHPGDATWVPPLDDAIYRQLVMHLRGKRANFPLADLDAYLTALKTIVEQVRPFHWELEFPEIYFDDHQPRNNPGFDAILGNPPWDIIKPNSREFFSEYDPAFRELERADAEERQQKLLTDDYIRAIWQSYVSALENQVDYLRLSDIYPYQSVVVDGKQTGGDANTYKLFLERAYQLLRHDGLSGLIVPSGLYTDQGCTGLRQLFFSQTQINHLLCFENRHEIFPIHRSFKFVLFGIRKQQADGAFDAAFMLHDMDVLATPEEHTLSVPTSLIQRFSPDTLSIMEFRSQRDADIVSHLYNNPLLGEKIAGAWSVAFTREFDITNDRDLFNQIGAGWPFYEGKMIHQYTHRFSEPRYWIEAALGREDLARVEIQHVEEALDSLIRDQPTYRKFATRQARVASLLKANGRGPLSEEDVKIAPDTLRIAFRKIARNTDERTLIAAALPQNVFAGDSLNYLVPWRFNAQRALQQLDDIKSCYQPALSASILAYLCGVLNAFTLDYALRFKVSANVNMFYVYQLPVPRLTEDERHCRAIARRVGQLVCVGEEFDGLRRELLGDVQAEVATEPEERQRLQNEIDALVAHLYRLTLEDVQHILYAPYTFPLVSPTIKEGVLAAFARVEELLVEE